MNNDERSASQQSEPVVSSISSDSNRFTNVPDLSDPTVLQSLNIEKTLNKNGFSCRRVNTSSIQPWITSLPDSKQPLADLGACYGVHTIHALKHGRNVLALDADYAHISMLRERVSQLKTPGKLIDAVVATLPCEDIFEEESFSGVLVSEVLHFLPLHVPQQLFKDIYKWLEPGGTLVTVSMSPYNLENGNEKDCRYNGDISYEQAQKLFRDVPDNIVDLAPGFVELGPQSHALEMFPHMLYFMTWKEVRSFAESVGFIVESCEYRSLGKYFTDRPMPNESVMLVAKKPV